MINNNIVNKNIDKSLLEELEQKRIVVEKKSNIFTIVTVFSAIALFFYNVQGANDLDDIFVPLLFIGIFGMIFYVGGNAFITSEYNSRFKLEIIKPIIEGMNKTFYYQPDKHMPRYIFKRSKLFGIFNMYSGDDFISGEVDGVKFSFSELSVFHERGTGKDRTVVKIFEGIFCEFDFNKHFSSTLLIYPDVAEKYFGHFGQWLQSINFTKDQLIKLDNPEFEKHFVVYGSDQIEARYLLTYSMMEYILKLRENLNAPIYISFNESKLYIGVDYDGAQQFEPDITASLFDSSYMQGHLDKINYHIEIIENFKLNEYLWSKQPKKTTKAQNANEIQTKIVADLESTENLIDNDEESKEAQITKNQEQITKIQFEKAFDSKDIYEKFKNESLDIIKSLNKQLSIVSFKKILFTVFMILATIALSVWISNNVYKAFEAIAILWIVVFLGILFGNAAIESSYKENYKTTLITNLFKHINPNLVYSPYNAITQDEIYNSSLFEDWSSAFRGDLIEGKISGFNVKGSDLDLELEESKVFKGYFFIFDLKNYYSALELIIYPLASNHDAGRMDKVGIFDKDTTEDIVDLNKKTYMYGSDEDAAKIFTKEFISKYLYFYRVLMAKKVFMSFKDSKMYVGFDFDKSFFDAPTDKKIEDADEFLFYITFFNAVEELMNCLKPQK